MTAVPANRIRSKALILMLAALMFLCVVVPNSFKTVATALLALDAVAIFLINGVKTLNNRYFMYLSLSVFVTTLYIVIGMTNGAPEVAVYQVLLIYIAFPLVWGVLLSGIVQLTSPEVIVRWLLFALFLGVLSVAYYFWAYQALGAYAVKFLVEDPNVDISSQGYVAAIMYVYGSMIFLVGGLFASPGVIKRWWLRVAMIVLALSAALTSGRSALILSIVLGLLVGAGHNVLNSPRKFNFLAPLRMIGILVGGMLSVVVVTILFQHFVGLDLTIAMEILVEKLFSKGGAGRSDQSIPLMQGIFDSIGLGRGHGVGVDYVVSLEFPWRYEMIWLATIFRTGLIGAAIYAAPFVAAAVHGGTRLISGTLSPSERFLFGGFICAFVASNTNPYIEGLVFQWMYVLPLVYFLAFRKTQTSGRAATIPGNFPLRGQRVGVGEASQSRAT